MAFRAVRLVCLVLAVATAGCASGDGGANGGGSADATPTEAARLGRSTTFQKGTPIAWTPDGAVVTWETSQMGPSTVRGCREAQERVRIRLRAPENGTGPVVAGAAAVLSPRGGSVSPDGAHLAVLGECLGDDVVAVSVVSMRSGSVRTLPLGAPAQTRGWEPLVSLAWTSPAELLVRRGGEALAVDVATMRARVVHTAPDLVAVRPLPGGRLLALSGPGEGTYRVEVVESGGAVRRVDTADGAEPAPDGSRFAAWTVQPEGGAPYDPRLRLVPLDGGRTTYVRLHGDVRRVVWSPRSDRLLVMAESYIPTPGMTASPGWEDVKDLRTRVYVVGLDGDVREVDTTGVDDDSVWSSDGTRIAYARDDDVHVVSL